MKTLVRTTASIGSTELILAILAVARNKYLAMAIGPAGIGMYSLVNSFFSTVGVFAGTWIANGTTKYISEYRDEGKIGETNRTYSLSTGLVSGLGLVLTGILVLGNSGFRAGFLSGEVTKSYYILFAAGFFWMNLGTVFLAVLQGMMEVRSVIKARILNSVVDLGLIFILIYLFNMFGFFLSAALSSLWGAVVFSYYIRTRCRLQFEWTSPTGAVASKLLRFGGVTLFLALINLGSQYVQRVMVMRKMGMDAVGIFQAGISLMEYIGLFNRGSTFYFLPKMSQKLTDLERTDQIEKYLFVCISICAPICVGVILFGEWGTKMLYSDRFVSLSGSLFWFMLAALLSAVGVAFQLALVGSARLGMHTVSVIAIHTTWVLIPYLWLEKYGISSLAMGLVGGAMVGIVLNYLYLYRFIRLRLSGRCVYLFVVALSGLLISKEFANSGICWRLGIFGALGGAMLCSILKLKDVR